MKKIMFNDKYCLTDAVLEGRKTMTRRIVPDGTPLGNWSETVKHSKYQQGEEVAIAQKYRDLCNCDAFYDAIHKADPTFPLECIKDEKGCDNKMFVKAEWMPHRICIVDVKAERLQDISIYDVLKEGIECKCINKCLKPWEFYLNYFDPQGCFREIRSNEPRAVFAFLIDKLMGLGTWERNPWVFAYEFRLLR